MKFKYILFSICLSTLSLVSKGQHDTTYANSAFPFYKNIDDEYLQVIFESMLYNDHQPNDLLEIVDDLTKDLSGTASGKRDLFFRKYMLGFKPRKNGRFFLQKSTSYFYLEKDMNFLRFGVALGFLDPYNGVRKYLMENYANLYLIPDQFDGLNVFDWMLKRSIVEGHYSQLEAFLSTCDQFSRISNKRLRSQLKPKQEIDKIKFQDLMEQINGMRFQSWTTVKGPYTPGINNSPCAEPGSTMTDAINQIKMFVENGQLNIYTTSKMWVCPDRLVGPYRGPGSFVTFHSYKLSAVYAVFIGEEGVTLFTKAGEIHQGNFENNRNAYQNTSGLQDDRGNKRFTIQLPNAEYNERLYNILSNIAQSNYYSGRTKQFYNNNKIMLD